jgi:alkanesulfonate monooxygenase SsuD/methylene tetrahydromethanopterin reductase-like flavin-dependent oxidoreductase (luciferase family)
MRLGFFTMPLHPVEREWRVTLQEDRQAFILADKLGFYDAFVGEHLTDRAENVTNSFQFLASLISDTDQIRLGTGTANLSQTHPVLIAAHAAMFDHLSNGRLIFGISPGSLPADAEVLGTLDEDRNKMFVDAINVILETWTREPPYNIDLPGNRWKVSTERMGKPELGYGRLHRPFQQPYPEIVGTVVAPFSKGVIEMGKRDFHPMSANFLLSKWVKSHWPNYVEGKKAVGATASPGDWRVARTVFVADDDKVAERYGRTDPKSPYRHYYETIRTKFAWAKRLAVFKETPEEPDDTVTTESVTNKLVIAGTVNRVVDEILALRQQVGDFGELVYAGLDWVDAGLAKRSMQLMAEQVMPRVNAAIKSPAAHDVALA